MKLQFGFSFIGILFLLMLFVPNILWTKHMPQGYEDYAKKEPKPLVLLERIGEACSTCTILFFHNPGSAHWLLAAALALMLAYEYYWLRYFRSEKTMADFYSPLLGIPVPGASLPVAAFFLLALYGNNLPLLISTIILAFGHIGIHLQHWKELQARPPE